MPEKNSGNVWTELPKDMKHKTAEEILAAKKRVLNAEATVLLTRDIAEILDSDKGLGLAARESTVHTPKLNILGLNIPQWLSRLGRSPKQQLDYIEKGEE